MFVQVIDCRLKDGKWEDFAALMEAWGREDAHLAPGYIGDDIIRDRNDPNHVVMIGKFVSAEKAAENSRRPEVTANYYRMLALLESEPTFVDGDLALQVSAPSSERVSKANGLPCGALNSNHWPNISSERTAHSIRLWTTHEALSCGPPLKLGVRCY